MCASSEENRDIVVEAKVLACDREDLVGEALFTVDVDYFDLISNTMIQKQCSVPLITRLHTGHAAEKEESNLEVLKHKLRHEATTTLDESMTLADRGDLEKAARVLQVSSLHPCYPSTR